MGNRLCPSCLEMKEDNEYRVRERRLLKSGKLQKYYSKYCRICQNKIQDTYKKERYPHGWIRSRYNLTDEEARIWYKKAQGFCEICGKVWEEGQENFCIDHDHNTQRVRGILCKSCNHLLGHAYDNIDTLESAIVYLRRTGGYSFGYVGLCEM